MSGSLTVPTVLNNLGQGNQFLSIIDGDFSAITVYVNDREITIDVAANRPAFGKKGRYYFATDTGGGTLYNDTGSAWQQLAPGLTSTTGGTYSVRGLIGINNAGTPNTKYDLTSADQVVLRNPSGGAITVRSSLGALTIDFGTVGANGLDAGTQAASTWYHLYYIDNGSTTSALASLVAPPTGPALPGGYTAWAYAGAVRSDGSTHLVQTGMRGNACYYGAKQNALNGGNATVETAISLTTLVPPNVVAAICSGRSHVVGGSTTTDQIRFRWLTGLDYMTFGQSSGTAGDPDSGGFEIPVVGQQIFYISVTGGTALTGDLDILGYRVPNGG